MLCTGAIAYSSAKFGYGTGPIYYRYFACSGNEATLSNCSKTSGSSGCSHSLDAGIRCFGSYSNICI